MANSLPVENAGNWGHVGYKLSGRYPLNLTKCNKMAEHFRESIKRLGDHPSAADWKADLEQLEAHIEHVRARNRARRVGRQTHSVQCPTCGAEYDFDSAKDAAVALVEWKRK